MKKVETLLLKVNIFKYLLFFILLNISIMITIGIINYLFGVEAANRKSDNIDIIYFIKLVVIAPIIETFFFQFLPIEFGKLFTKKKAAIILITGTIFGFLHYFNDYLVRDFITTSIFGYLYAYVYFLTKRRDDIKPIVALIIIHSLYNLFVFALKVYYK